eukprot:TRINITY_DN5356_c0_g1_i14.p1 TRINITY_DN5356_c0_g1~~TRINITY_DN5356_c0_g1_i14.p1  ORF type:complete len:113 (+),score=10.53 TRINITY_DN5356_c0_g1_i14:73-411(+)
MCIRDRYKEFLEPEIKKRKYVKKTNKDVLVHKQSKLLVSESKMEGMEEFKSFQEKGLNLKVSLSNAMATPSTTANLTKKEPIPSSELPMLLVSAKSNHVEGYRACYWHCPQT